MTEAHMARAIALARRAQGTTSPNPPVGAVIVKDGKVVAEGFTKPAGQAHAEIVALEAAGAAAAGSTLYVTLEPCSHWGRTPPCADAIVAAHISAVHIAVLDPNPSVNGAGLRHLSQHGIKVTQGECAEAAAELMEAHAKYIRRAEPFVTLLLGPPVPVRNALEQVTDAILSDLWDCPRQGHHTPSFLRPPLTVLVDDSGDWQVPADPRTVVATSRPLPRGQEAMESQILRLPGNGETVDFSALLQELGRHEITSCLAAGSETLAGALLAQRLVDKIVAQPDTIAPPGFRSAGIRLDPAPHIVLYPSESSETMP